MAKTLLTLVQHIEQSAELNPLGLALQSGESKLSYRELSDGIKRLSSLFDWREQVVALAMDNGIAWAVLDLALLAQHVPNVPIPLFFSQQQTLHAIQDAGVSFLFTDNPQHYLKVLIEAGFEAEMEADFELCGRSLTLIKIAVEKHTRFPRETIKITYTSGTTGAPKGVCLSEQTIARVVKSLLERTEANAQDVHLSLLPLSTLLENLAGLYVPLLAGGCCVLPSFNETGLGTASGLDASKMYACLKKYQVTTTITTPELLLGLVSHLRSHDLTLPKLRFVAVGGASVSPQLLANAAKLGLPVYEGYGLSECASVVAVNGPGTNQPGSVGKPLPHLQVSFADDGEVIVTGNCMLGYVGQTNEFSDLHAWPTGDIGFLDKLGYLHIAGRKKNIFITSFGRNVSPEWVERELMVMPAIAQAMVFGEAKPFNVAIIFARKGFNSDAVASAIEVVNSQLPDYARVGKFVLAEQAFTPANGLLTSNGRLKREAIYLAYQSQIEKLYEESTDVVL